MTEEKNTKTNIVVISGPSGVGKSTICRKVVEQMKDVVLSVSVTTRPRTDSEKDGYDYWFISEEEFQRRIKNDMFIEHAGVFGNSYGTPKDKVEELLKNGKTAILEIDVQGGKAVKDIYPNAVMIFILAPTQKHLAERLNDRARDDSLTNEKRLDGASVEIAAAWQHYEHMVINDDLQQAVKEVIQIISSH